MAPTFRHGKSGFFSITSATGGTINLSSGLDDVKVSRSLATADVTHFGNNDKNYIVGLRDATLACTGIWASTHATKLDAMLGSTSGGAWVFGPESTAVNRRKLTGTAIMTKLEYGVQVGARVSVTFDLQNTGAVTSTHF